MHILHYSLGFPPYRTGGLTKFCMDLLSQQKKEGHEVALIWPGAYTLGRKTRIKSHTPVNGIRSYEILNPNPVPYDEGIIEIQSFITHGEKQVYSDMLSFFRPDVIHIHTLMGLQDSFLDAASEKNIRLVFSTHDFFPICPKVTMYREGNVCDCVENCAKCETCNSTALSLTQIKVLQSALYREMKDSAVVKKLRKGHRDSYLNEKMAVTGENTPESARKYIFLREYYRNLLNQMTVIHYNSKLTKQVYDKYLKVEKPATALIGITHSDIHDLRKRKTFNNTLRMTYLGPQGGVKGFFA